jgi:CubicO group peptidase (beta-lactamase class C family)
MTKPLFHRRTVLKSLGFGATALGLKLLPRIASATSDRPSPLPRASPESQDVASSGILDFVNEIESRSLNLHSLMVLRHGHVIAEGWWAPYAAHLRHTLYSLSKSFTATAIGIAVAEGRFELSDLVASFFPQELPSTISPMLAAMRINDLLMMGAGHAKDALLDVNFTPPGKEWVRFILSQPVKFQPGIHFTYNNAAPYLLSAILQKVTGKTLLAYLQPRLFDPLGIEGADWENSPEGVNAGGWGLRVRTEDIAKFGQLYLQKGDWNGQRIVAGSWVDQATRAQLPTAIDADFAPADAQTSDWAQGYGYQFWRCRHGAYRADGAFGQFCLVLPMEDAVIAMTSETADMQAVLNAVWTHLLPALQGVGVAHGSGANLRLKEKLASLTLPLPAGDFSSTIAARVGASAYSIADNPLGIKRVSMSFAKDKTVFTMQDAQMEHQITCGVDRWLEGESDLSSVPLKLVPTAVPGESKTRIAAAGAWSNEKTFVMHWRFFETAHYQRVTCYFDGDRVRIELKKSLSILDPTIKDERPVLEGTYKS